METAFPRGHSESFPPPFSCRLQESVGSNDVGLYERLRSRDGSIDMTIGGKVHHRIDVILFHDPFHQLTIADISVNKTVPVFIRQPLQVIQGPSVCQKVEIDHARAWRCLLKMPHEIAADETRASCDQHLPGSELTHVHDKPFQRGKSESLRFSRQGLARSRSDTMASPAGHWMSIPGSSQRMPRSRAGS